MIHLLLPWPPSMNSLYPSAKNGRRFLSKRGKDYQVAVKVALRGLSAPSGRLAYKAVMFPPDRRKRDLSNHLKALEDCLTKCGFWEDDSLVDDLQATRGPIRRDGMVEVAVWALP